MGFCRKIFFSKIFSDNTGSRRPVKPSASRSVCVRCSARGTCCPSGRTDADADARDRCRPRSATISAAA